MGASPLPHLVAGTAKPMPSRMAAIARGTGEVDAAYHVALNALQSAVEDAGSTQQKPPLGVHPPRTSPAIR